MMQIGMIYFLINIYDRIYGLINVFMKIKLQFHGNPHDSSGLFAIPEVASLKVLIFSLKNIQGFLQFSAVFVLSKLQ